MQRNVLLNPGPATTTDSVKKAQVVPDICPREKEFSDIMKSISHDLLAIVHADSKQYSAVLFCGSGTLCMDVCLNSLLPAGKKILVINNGAYSARAVDICKAYGLDYIELSFQINQRPDMEIIEQALCDNPNISVVYATHQETGTGILNQIRDIGAVAHMHNAIMIADTTSTLAMRPIYLAEENIDFCMASAQKGIQAMTGLSFIIGRTDIIEASKDYPVRSYYCNLYLQYHYFCQTGQMHFTPPVQTIYAVYQALKEYFIEGESAKWQRHQRAMALLRSSILTLGFQEVIPIEWQSGLVLAIRYPNSPKWNFEQVHDYCYQRGFTIYPGKMQACNTFRLCTLGAVDEQDIKNFLAVFKEALNTFHIDMSVC